MKRYNITSNIEHRYLFNEDLSGDYLGSSAPAKQYSNYFYCDSCGNPVDELGRNISKKRLSKWNFMNARPILGNCCVPEK